MRYSLLSRFKGTLLGMAAAEAYARERLGNSADGIASPMALTISLGQVIETGIDFNAQILQTLETDISSLAIAVTVALLAHEKKAKLVEQITLAASRDRALAASRSEMLAIGYVIYRSLHEKLLPQQLIAKLCRFLPEDAAELFASLARVQSWLEKSATLAQIHFQPKERAVCVPIYSFLSTPEDYVLTVQRAFQLNRHLGTCALAGALSGAYNGFSSIPVTWRLRLPLEEETEIEQLSEQLLAAWSGVYRPRTQGKMERTAKLARRGHTPIAAPQVMSSHRFKV